jgi:hypothetical protein
MAAAVSWTVVETNHIKSKAVKENQRWNEDNQEGYWRKNKNFKT